MGLSDCLRRAEKEGLVDIERSRQARKVYKQFKYGLQKLYSDAEAEAIAKKKAIEVLREQAVVKARRDAINAKIQLGVKKNLQDIMAKNGKVGYAALSMVTPVEGFNHVANVVTREESLSGLFYSQMPKFIEHFRRTSILSRERNKQDFDLLVRAIHGEKVDNKLMMDIADEVKGVMKLMRERWNEANGGIIRELKNYDFPHEWDREKMAQIGVYEMTNFLMPLLDRNRMLDEVTGLPLDDAALRASLKEFHKTISNDGYADFAPSMIASQNRNYNLNQMRRFLHFKDADSWIKANDRLGAKSAVDSIVGRVDRMAREISMMEIFGSNPAAMKNWIEGLVNKQANLIAYGKPKGAIEKARTGMNDFNRMFDALYSTGSRYDTGFVSNKISTLNNVVTSSLLGSVFLWTPFDVGTQMMSRRFNGLSIPSYFKEFSKIFNPASDKKDLEIALKQGLGAEGIINMNLAMMRVTGDFGAGSSQRLVHAVMGLQLANRATRINKWAAQQSILDGISLYSRKSFSELQKGSDARFKEMLDRYGFKEKDWKAITSIVNKNPKERLRVDDIYFNESLDKTYRQQLSTRLLDMMKNEEKFMLTQGSLRGRYYGKNQGPLGEFLGRSANMFKNTPITLFYTHWARALSQATKSEKAAYLGQFIIMATITGGITMTLQALSRGQVPDYKDPTFYTAAALKGGAFGVIGDILANNGFGFNPAGPLADIVSSFLNLTSGNANDLIKGKDTHAGADLMKIMRQSIPGGNLWYSRLLFERYILDNMQRTIDPNAQRYFKTKIASAKNFGSTYYWEPGDTTFGGR